MSETTLIRFAPWPDAELERRGFPALGDYVERVWVSAVGPTSVVCLRAAVRLVDEAGGPVTVALAEFAASLGLSPAVYTTSPIRRVLSRLCDFRLIVEMPDGYGVPGWVPPLSGRLLERAPRPVRDLHERFVADPHRGDPPPGGPGGAGRGHRPGPRIPPSSNGPRADGSSGGSLRGEPPTNQGGAPVRGSVASSALIYARRGWLVLPCHRVDDTACSCGHLDCTSPGKHPLLRHGLHDASADPEVVRRWWRRWPHANVGLRTGADSGLVVLDIDPDHGGEASLARLVSEHAALPAGPEVTTGSGGRHLYFAHPARQVRNRAGTRLGAGVDVRGDGGYVIAPPSRHASGSTYRWARLGPLPALPGWILDLLTAPRRTPARTQPTPPPGNLTAWARAALERELHGVRTAPVGQRNHQLNRAAYSLGQIVAGGHLAESVVAGLLEEAALAAGLGIGETRATIASGMRAGAEHPRHPSAGADSRTRP